MKTIGDVLKTKGPDIWAIAPDATVYDALTLMADKDVGAVLVMDAQGRLVGILSERDYARKVALKGHTSREMPVASIMTEKVIYVSADRTLEECMALMSAHRIRHLPVMGKDRLIGVVSIGDIVKAIISDQGFVIEQLEGYIRGAR
jgi:CBS domain-containing protein